MIDPAMTATGAPYIPPKSKAVLPERKESPAPQHDEVTLHGKGGGPKIMRNLADSSGAVEDMSTLQAMAEVLKDGELLSVEKVWEFETGGPVGGAPVPGKDGTVFSTSEDGHIYALKEGKKVWDYDTGGAIKGGACMTSDGTLIMGNEIMKLTAVKDGKKLWECETTGKVVRTPVIGSDNRIYSVNQQGSVDIISDGYPVYGHYIEDWLNDPAAGPDGVVYVKRYSGELMALKYKEGFLGGKKVNVLWNIRTGNGIDTSGSGCAAGKDGTVYTGNNEGQLLAIKDGKEQWQGHTHGRIDSTPAVGPDGTVYVGSNDGNLYAFKDGREMWKGATKGEIHCRPSVGPDGTVYVGSDDGRVYAFKEGHPLWSFKTGDKVRSSPAVDGDGTVYAGSNDGKVYALRACTVEESSARKVEEKRNSRKEVDSDDQWLVVDGVRMRKKKDAEAS